MILYYLMEKHVDMTNNDYKINYNPIDFHIFYEHIWSNDYKGIINKIKENRDK